MHSHVNLCASMFTFEQLYRPICKNKIMYAYVRAVVHVSKFYLCVQLM